MDGFESFVSPNRFIVGVSLGAIGAFVGAVHVMLEGAEGRVSAVGDTCPVCRGDTERLKRRAMRRLLSTFMGGAH